MGSNRQHAVELIALLSLSTSLAWAVPARGQTGPARESLPTEVLAGNDPLQAAPGGPLDGKPQGETPETSAEGETPPWHEAFSVEGLVDLNYGFNFNRPRNGDNFAFGGSTGKRHNAFSVNLISIGLHHEPDPLGFHLVVHYGTGANVLRSGENIEPGVGLEILRAIQQASLVVRPDSAGKLEIEAGVFPSHIGFESFISNQNWNYTRGWMGETVPYTQTGIRLHYKFTDIVSGELFVLNGWQTITDNNDAKTIGTRLAFAEEDLSLSFNTLLGPEQADNNDLWRLFGDLVLLWTPNAVFSLAASADFGWEDQPGGDSAVWGGAGLLGRVALLPELAIAGRAELFIDDEGIITGIPQTLVEGTLTLEYAPFQELSLKLETRLDHSTEEVFFTASGTDAVPNRARSQFLIIVGAVGQFGS